MGRGGCWFFDTLIEDGDSYPSGARGLEGFRSRSSIGVCKVTWSGACGGWGMGGLRGNGGIWCQLPGAFVSGYCSTPPRCRGALVSAAKGAFFIAGFDRRRAMVRIFDSIIAWCDVGPPDSDTLVSAFVCYRSGSSIATVGLQLDSLF